MFTAADVRQWLTQAQHLDLTDATSRRGILLLEQLVAALVPKETSLLPNYPNPFNPETWVPYQLSEPAEVTLHIYLCEWGPWFGRWRWGISLRECIITKTVRRIGMEKMKLVRLLPVVFIFIHCLQVILL